MIPHFDNTSEVYKAGYCMPLYTTLDNFYLFRYKDKVYESTIDVPRQQIEVVDYVFDLAKIEDVIKVAIK